MIMDYNYNISSIQPKLREASRDNGDNAEILHLYGESINALQQSAAALQAAYAKYLDSGISQAQTESSGTPMSLTVDEMAEELNISRGK